MKVTTDATGNPANALPEIRRMRGFRLYSGDGRRFLDLSQSRGLSCLGAKPSGLGRDVKDALDRGAVLSAPCPETRELARALARLFPAHRSLAFFPSREEADRAALALSGVRAPFDPAERASPGMEPGPYVVARAFPRDLRSLRGTDTARALRIETGCPAAFPLGILALRDDADAALVRGRGFRPPALLAKAHASCAFSAIAALWPAASPKRPARVPDFESTWSRVDRWLADSFERDGPWLYPRCARDRYQELFVAGLRGGVLLSETWDFPSVVPIEFDDGEIAALRKVLDASGVPSSG